MMLLVPAESVNTCVVMTLFMTQGYPLNNSYVIIMINILLKQRQTKLMISHPERESWTEN